jgi:hypothetical protein
MCRYKISMWWWRSRIRRWYYKVKYRLTGDCGHYCDYHMLHNVETGEATRMFVPEAGCAIHDTE